jgi:Sec-independent protein secretion pathway component TatC
MFAVGTTELCLLATLVTLSLLASLFRIPGSKWLHAGLGCATLAAFVTPADVYSMLVASTVLFSTYYAGTRHKINPTFAAGT